MEILIRHKYHFSLNMFVHLFVLSKLTYMMLLGNSNIQIISHYPSHIRAVSIALTGKGFISTGE